MRAVRGGPLVQVDCTSSVPSSYTVTEALLLPVDALGLDQGARVLVWEWHGNSFRFGCAGLVELDGRPRCEGCTLQRGQPCPHERVALALAGAWKGEANAVRAVDAVPSEMARIDRLPFGEIRWSGTSMALVSVVIDRDRVLHVFDRESSYYTLASWRVATAAGCAQPDPRHDDLFGTRPGPVCASGTCWSHLNDQRLLGACTPLNEWLPARTPAMTYAAKGHGEAFGIWPVRSQSGRELEVRVDLPPAGDDSPLHNVSLGVAGKGRIRLYEHDQFALGRRNCCEMFCVHAGLRRAIVPPRPPACTCAASEAVAPQPIPVKDGPAPDRVKRAWG